MAAGAVAAACRSGVRPKASARFTSPCGGPGGRRRPWVPIAPSAGWTMDNGHPYNKSAHRRPTTHIRHRGTPPPLQRAAHGAPPPPSRTPGPRGRAPRRMPRGGRRRGWGRPGANPPDGGRRGVSSHIETSRGLFGADDSLRVRGPVGPRGRPPSGALGTPPEPRFRSGGRSEGPRGGRGRGRRCRT